MAGSAAKAKSKEQGVELHLFSKPQDYPSTLRWRPQEGMDDYGWLHRGIPLPQWNSEPVMDTGSCGSVLSGSAIECL